MDTDLIIDEVPALYAVLLMLQAAGRSDEEIAGVLDVPLEAVRTMARLACSKLERVLDGLEAAEQP